MLQMEDDLSLINGLTFAFQKAMQNPNILLSKEQILQKLWDGEGDYVDSNTLTVYIRRLHIKIEDNPSEPQMLLNIRRMGYKWNIICEKFIAYSRNN